MDKLPKLANLCLNLYDGYLVGSAAEKYYRDVEEGDIGNRVVEVKDYDIIIPPDKWNTFMSLVPQLEFIKFKRLGGIKVRDEDKTFDIWCMNLGEFFQTLPARYSGYAVNQSGDIIKRVALGV